MKYDGTNIGTTTLDSSDDDIPPPLATRGNLCNDDSTHDNSSDDVPAPPLLQREMSSGDESSDDEQYHRRGYRVHFHDSDSEDDDWKCYPVTRSASRKREAKVNDKKTPKRGDSKTPERQSRPPKPRRKRKKKKDEFRDQSQDEPDPDGEPPILPYNNLAKSNRYTKDELEEPNPDTGEQIPGIGERLLKPSKKDVAEYSKYFPGTDIDTLRKTFDATTQHGSKGATEGHTLRNQITSPNPILNIPRRHEAVATDTLYSDTPAFDSGSTAAQFFIGRSSMFRTARRLGSSDKSFANTLSDEIRKYGAMDKLVSDNAKAEISEKVKDILRTFAIDDWQSEPYKGNQNFAERGWRDTKTKVNSLLNSSGAPAAAWMLALEYICFVQNHTAVDSLGGRTPIEWLLGYTPDISVLLQFQFWEPVLYSKHDGKFPSDNTELMGRFVGVSEHVGHGMTYKILTEDDKIITRARARTALKEGGFKNKNAEREAPKRAPKTTLDDTVEVEDVDSDDEDDSSKSSFTKSIQQDILKSLHEDRVNRGESLPTIDSTGLLGRTFIPNPDENGEQTRAKIEGVDLVNQQTADKKEELYKFRCKVGDKTFEHVLTYNKMLEWCERDQDRDDMYRVEAITGHKKDPKAAGGYKLKVSWATGEVTWEDLSPTFQDDPTSVSLYAMKNDLAQRTRFQEM